MRRFDCGPQRDELGFRRRPSGFQIGQHQQIRGDIVQTDAVRADDLQKFAIVLLVLQGPVQQRLRISLNGGERRAQFVRDVGDEILADALQPLQVADVVQDGEAAAARGGAQGTGLHFVRTSFAAGKLQPRFHRLARFQHALDNLDQRRILHQAVERHVIRNRHVRAHGAGEGTVTEHHAAVLADRQHAFHHAGQDRLQACRLHAETIEQIADLRAHARQRIGQRAQLVIAFLDDRGPARIRPPAAFPRTPADGGYGW